MSATSRRAPVVSIGNLAMGGRGKTPVAALVARLLLAAGEQPAILSRGYRRRHPVDGVVIVSDGQHLVADLDRSGDEPLLMARLAPGAAVLVHEQRAMAAAVAERVIGSTVHVLDDGFQHTSLIRDIDIVIVTPDDLSGRPLPLGRLRSPVSALANADAVIVDGETGDARAKVERLISPEARAFGLERALGTPAPLEPERGWSAEAMVGRRVVAFAGIAGPDRFGEALRRSGWDVAELVAFPDHHRYERKDLDRVAAAVDATGAGGALTTEKDAMRLLRLRPLPVAIASVPLEVNVVPPAEFRDWLVARVREVRG
jgi:tetraacyldisaccharide 4'-kinase